MNPFRNFNYLSYINMNKDLKHLNSKQALIHFKKFGIKEKRKFNRILENFDYTFYTSFYKDLSKLNFLQACNHYIEHGRREGRNFNKLKKFNYKLYDFKNLIINNRISHVKISKSMINFKRILSIYNLKEFTNNSNIVTNNFIVFGVYFDNDINFIKNYIFRKDQIMFILLGGTDFFINKKFINELRLNKNIKFLSISENMHDRLNSININSQLINFNLVDTKIFKPIPEIEQTKIYLYDGDGKGGNKYNIGKLNTIQRLLPNFKYIKTSDYWKNGRLIPNSEMPKIYAQCFIGLRLTENDGNANTVQEFEAMKIPIVHNQSNYGLKWKNINDIINHINNTFNNLNNNYNNYN